VAGLLATAVVDVASVRRAFLALTGEDVDAPRRVVKALHYLDHIRTGVFLRAEHSTELEVRPVDVRAVDGQRERINRSVDDNLKSPGS